MAIPKFIRHMPKQGSEHSYDMVVVQEKIEEILGVFSDNPINDNLLIEDIVIGSTTTDISHTLGRTVRGWFFVKKNANADIWQDTTSTSDPTRFLSLIADTEVTISLIVF